MTPTLRRLATVLCLAGTTLADPSFTPSDPFPGLPLLLDLDGDGRLDLMTREQREVVLRRNQDGRVFRETARYPAPDSAGTAWRSDAGDFDRDNLPDSVWLLPDGSGAGAVRLGSGVDVSVGTPFFRRLPGGGGFGDTLVVGIPTAPGRSSGIWRTDPDGVAVLQSLEPRLRPFWRGDLDGDGRPEILGDRDGALLVLPGNSTDAAPHLLAWTNRTDAPARLSTVADLDGDGRPEILRNGSGEWSALFPEPGTGFAYRRVGFPGPAGPGLEFNQPATAFPPVVSDLDGDGLPDVVVRDQAWIGPGLGRSAPVRWLEQAHEAPAGVVAAADLDGDGRPELVGVTWTEGRWWTRIHWNRSPAVAAPPEAPGDLSQRVAAGEVRLGWNAHDGRCGAFHTFNLRVGTAPGKGDVVSPLSGPSGERRVAGPGNAGSTGETVLTLPPGTYYWAVQSVGPGGLGGPFREGPAFRVLDPTAFVPTSTPDTRPRVTLTLLTSTNAGPGDTWIYRVNASDTEQSADTLRFSVSVAAAAGEPLSAALTGGGSERLLVVRTSPRSYGTHRVSVTAADASGNTGAGTASITLPAAPASGRIVFGSLTHRIPGGVLSSIPFEVVADSGVQPALAGTVIPSPGTGVRLWLQRLDAGELVGRARWRMTFLAPDTGKDATNGTFRVTVRPLTAGSVAPVEITLQVEPGPVSVIPVGQATRPEGIEPWSPDGGGRFSALLSGASAQGLSLGTGWEPVLERYRDVPLSGPIRIDGWLGDGALSVVNTTGTATLRRLSGTGPSQPVASGGAGLRLPANPAFLDLDGDGDTDVAGAQTGAGSAALSTGTHLVDKPRWVPTDGLAVGAAVGSPDRRSGSRWATVHRGVPARFVVWELRGGTPVAVGGEEMEGNLGTLHQAGWCDLDGDGLLDLWISGQRNGPTVANVLEVYRRLDEDGVRFQRIQTLTGVRALQSSWADLDGDDQPEAVLAADAVGNLPSELQRWEADASGRLVPQGSLNLTGGATGTLLATADFDGDGRPDLLRVAGETGLVRFLLNRFGTPSTPPPAPASVSARFEEGRIVVSWSGSGRPGITGNVRIGTTPGGSEIVSALASPSGGRKVFRAGNAGPAGRFVLDPSRVRGRVLYVAVQELNAAFVGGPFAPEVEVELPGENRPPTFEAADAIEIRAGQAATFPLRVGDDRTAPGNLRIVAEVEDPEGSAIVLPGNSRAPHLADGDGRAGLPVAASADRVGLSRLRVTVTDDAGLVSTGRVSVLVLPTNTPPFLAAPVEVASTPGPGPLAFDVWIGDREEGPESLTLHASWAETPAVPTGSVTVSGNGAARRIGIMGVGGVLPEGRLLLTVVDSGGLSQSMTVRLHVGAGTGSGTWQLSDGFPARWSAQEGIGDALRFQTRSEPGRRYRLEASEDLRTWLPLRDAQAEGPFLETGIPIGPDTPAARFHRWVPAE